MSLLGDARAKSSVSDQDAYQGGPQAPVGLGTLHDFDENETISLWLANFSPWMVGYWSFEETPAPLHESCDSPLLD